MRAGKFAGVDVAFQVQIGVGFNAAGGAHGGNAAGEIKTRRRERHLRHQDGIVKMSPAVEIRPHDIEQVIVHADDAGHHGMSVKVKNSGRFVCGHVGARLNRGDLSAFDHNILIFNCRCAGAVNDPHVSEDDLAGIYPNQLLHRLRQFRSLGMDIDRSQKEYEEPATENEIA